MNKITDYDNPNGKTHAADITYERGPRGNAKTYCGRNITGHTGATIAQGITCGSCKRSMRREGYLV